MGNSSNSQQFNILCFGDSLTKGFYKDPENYIIDPKTNLPKYIFYAPYGDELKLLIGKSQVLPSDIKYCDIFYTFKYHFNCIKYTIFKI